MYVCMCVCVCVCVCVCEADEQRRNMHTNKGGHQRTTPNSPKCAVTNTRQALKRAVFCAAEGELGSTRVCRCSALALAAAHHGPAHHSTTQHTHGDTNTHCTDCALCWLVSDAFNYAGADDAF